MVIAVSVSAHLVGFYALTKDGAAVRMDGGGPTQFSYVSAPSQAETLIDEMQAQESTPPAAIEEQPEPTAQIETPPEPRRVESPAYPEDPVVPEPADEEAAPLPQPSPQEETQLPTETPQSSAEPASESAPPVSSVQPPAPAQGPTSPPSSASIGRDNATQATGQEGNAISANYAGEVMRHLSRVRRPRARVQGSAFIRFVIGRDGSLDSVEVQQSSGSPRFDRDALRVVERAAPYPPPPESANRVFTVEIEGR